MSTAFASKLAGLGAKWNAIRQDPALQEDGFTKIPDGTYTAAIVRAELTISKSSQRVQVEWEYLIIAGEQKGTTKRTWDGLDTPDNLMWLGRKLAKFGYDVTQLDLENQLEAVLTEIAEHKPTVIIRARTKGQYQNIYLDSVEDFNGLGEDDTEDAGAVDTAFAKGMLVEFQQSGKAKEGVIESVSKDGRTAVINSNGRKIEVPTDGLQVLATADTDA